MNGTTGVPTTSYEPVATCVAAAADQGRGKLIKSEQSPIAIRHKSLRKVNNRAIFLGILPHDGYVVKRHNHHAPRLLSVFVLPSPKISGGRLTKTGMLTPSPAVQPDAFIASALISQLPITRTTWNPIAKIPCRFPASKPGYCLLAKFRYSAEIFVPGQYRAACTTRQHTFRFFTPFVINPASLSI